MKNLISIAALAMFAFSAQAADKVYVFKAGHASLKEFVLGEVPYPADNKPNADRINLGLLNRMQ